MKIVIEIEPKEITGLIDAVQDRLEKSFSDAVIKAILQSCHSEVSEDNHHELEY